MKRIFIAIKTEPGKIFLSLLADLKKTLVNEKITWVNPENMHLTLHFLGDTPDDKINDLSRSVAQKISGFGEFSFYLRGTGVFKSFNDPKVIWTGIKDPETIYDINSQIINGLTDAGISVNDRSFKPHVTLGRLRRIKDRDILIQAVEKYHDYLIQEVNVSEVILFESILKETGAVYKPLAEFRL